MGKISQFLEPKPLKDKSQELLKTDLEYIGKAPESVVQVDKTTCKINGNFAAFRNIFIIPWFIGACISLSLHINDFVTSWEKAEYTALSIVEMRKSKFGENYFINTTKARDQKWYSVIGPDEKMSFEEYWKYRYDNDIGWGDRTFKLDILFGLIHLIVIPGFLIYAIRFKRRAPLIFDRERRLVITWRFGRAWVQRYDDLALDENIQAMIFVLQAYRPAKKDVVLTKYPIQPSGNPFFNSASSYQPLLAFLVQFMEYGREKVLPDGPMEDTKPGFYFFEDTKPEDFDEQVENILKKIDEEKAEEITTAYA